MRFNHVLLSLALLLRVVAASADDPIIKTHEYEKLVWGLSSNEASHFENVFKNTPLVDLELSGLSELSRWLDTTSDRLSTAIEKEGSYFATYRPFLTAGSDATIENYKYHPNAQHYYRGYVYFSTGMIKKLLQSLEATPETLTDEQARLFLDGLTGLIANEYAAPKHDEMGRHRMRAMQDINAGQLQADVVATDLLALRILRKANFNQDALLTGLELSYGSRPSTRREYLRRSLGALFSQRPEQKLRLNIVRASLAHERINKGEIEPKRIEFNLEALKKDLSRILIAHAAYEKTSDLNSGTAQSKALSFVGLLRELKVWIDPELNGGPETSRDYRARLLAIKSATENRTAAYNAEEISEFTNLIDFLVNEKGFMLAENRGWHGDTGNVVKKSLTKLDYDEVRRRQRLLNEIKAFDSPLFEAWLSERLKNVWQVFPFSGDGEFEFLPSVLPRKAVERIYHVALKKLSAQTPIVRARVLLSVLAGNIAMGGSVDFDYKVLRELRAQISADPIIFEVVIQLWPNLINVERRYFNERLLLWQKAYPENHDLIREYAAISKMGLERPESPSSLSLAKSSLRWDIDNRMLEILNWAEDPTQIFRRFNKNSKINPESVVKYFESLMKTPAWQTALAQAFAGQHAVSKGGDIESPIDALMAVLRHMNMPLTIKHKLRILRAATPNWSDEANYVSTRLGIIKALAGPFQVQAAIEFFNDALASGEKDPFNVIKRRFGDQADLIHELFNSDGSRFVKFLTTLNKNGKLSSDSLLELFNKYLLGTAAGEIAPGMFFLDRDAAVRLWAFYRKNGVRGTDFLKSFIPGFEAKRYGKITLKLENYQLKKDLQSALKVGIDILPQYARVVTHLSSQLASDLSFKHGFDQALEFYHLIFNPDAKLIPVHLRGLVSYDALDDLSKTFVALIPEGLTAEQYDKLWLELSAKRSNQYTDKLFETRIRAGKTHKQLLDYLQYNRVFAERVKVSVLREVFETEIASLVASKNKVSDKALYSLLMRIQGFVPKSSRFKDELLEDLAWRLKLNESQLVKFIEPPKSFNYAAMDMRTVNLMSIVSVVMEKLTNDDKLRLVDYVREPRGELLSAVPAFQQVFNSLKGKLYWMQESDMIQDLEASIKDAGEAERHLYLELLLGTKEVGLWHQGDAIREKLFDRAKLAPNTQNRILFDAYIKAHASYEHSIILAYLLALERGEKEGGFDLVSVLEMHRTPGVKFAQMASILGIFGEDTREQLAKTKDRAMKPSKYEIYKMLKDAYPAALYENIKDVHRMLGSGSLKVVALVEFNDGTMEAVSIKRPYSEDTIRSTLDMAQRWMAFLREHPDYTNAYDYDYYLTQLRKQLGNEVDFGVELKASEEMIKYYAKAKPVRGWSFGAVPPSKNKLQTNDVLHFMPITGTVKFEKMSPEDKKAAAELILDTELQLLFKRGIFDADRTLGNYLFDPKSKKVFPLDMGQVYHLQRGGLLTADDRFYLSQLIVAFSEENHDKAAERILRVFVTLNESTPPTKATQEALQAKIREALTSKDLRLDQRLLRVLTESNKAGVYVPLRYSMGIVKGLTILSNEEYAKAAPAKFIENRIRKFVRWQVLRGKVITLLGRDKCEHYLLGGQLQLPAKSSVE